jgi:hypothetical protein
MPLGRSAARVESGIPRKPNLFNPLQHWACRDSEVVETANIVMARDLRILYSSTVNLLKTLSV